MQENSNFKGFLNSKGNEYSPIDVDRFPKIYKKLNIKVDTKIIHIVGTNAKGSTGRALAYYLYKLGKNILHFSSPHILEVNERFWINNQNIEDAKLEQIHQKILSSLSSEDLNIISYFEYLTLMMIFMLNDFEYAVIEAGLGGEFDSTNVLKKELSLVTPIGLDHQEFLGYELSQIVKTKLNSINNSAIISSQSDRVEQIIQSLDISLMKVDQSLKLEVEEFVVKHNMANFLVDNILHALSAIIYLEKNITIDISLLDGLSLFGRFYRYKKNIIIDVGHNELAAKAIKKELGDKKIHLIYNTYKDKDYGNILTILKPNIEKLLILKLQNDRILNPNELISTLNRLGLRYEYFQSCYDNIDYLVFGSFSVIERFLKFE